MQWPTAGQWVLLVSLLVLGSFFLAIIQTCWEERKREKQRREEQKWQTK